MNPITLFAAIIFLYFTSNESIAQVKIIRDTIGYRLEETDSIYFFKHCLPPQKTFIPDTLTIKKQKGIIRLPLYGNKFVEIKDVIDTSNEAYSQTYSYLGKNASLKYFLVEGNFYEWGAYYLVNTITGETDTFPTEPFFSPKNKYFVTFFFDHMNEVSYPLSVNFYNQIKGAPRKIFSVSFTYQSIENFSWESEKVFLFITNIVSFDSVKTVSHFYRLTVK